MLRPNGRASARKSLICIWMILMGAVMVPQSLNAQCLTPPADLVAWWPGDYSTTDIVNGNNGILMNGATYAPGTVLECFDFTGANTFVVVPHHPTLNFGSSDFSIDAWIYPTDLSWIRPIVDKREDSAQARGYVLLMIDGTLCFQLAVDSRPDSRCGPGMDNACQTYSSGVSIPIDTWTHVAVTVDRDNPNGGLFYVNGTVVPQYFNPLTQWDNTDNSGDLWIGASHRVDVGGGPYYFDGFIDEVELFNRTLWGPEITSIYDAGAAGKCKCDPYRKLWTSVSGLDDNYSLTLDPPPTPSDGLKIRLSHASNRGYDNPVVDRHFYHTFEVPLSEINAAWLVVGMQPVAQQSEDDRIALCFTKDDGTPGSSLEWSAQIGAPGGLLPNIQWNPTNYPDRVIITLDLKSLPGTPWTILGPLNNYGFLDLWVRHDTDIDFAVLRVCYRCVRPPADIVAWWPGDKNTYDMLNGNNGTLMGDATYGSGKVASAFYFDDAADYVRVPHDMSGTLDFGTGDLSVDAWIRTWSTSIYPLIIVDKCGGSLAHPIGYKMFISRGKLGFQLGDPNLCLNWFSNNPDTPPLNDNDWHHVAVTVERSPMGGKMYVDGQLDRTFDPSAITGSISNLKPLCIGERCT